MRTRLFRTMVTIMMFLACGLTAYSQITTAPITGTVTDPNGAVINGATVITQNKATGAEVRSMTTSNGTFTVPALAVGSYIVTIEAKGFKKLIISDVSIAAGVPATVNATLEIGAANETVVIQGGAELLQTQSANVSTTLSTTQIAQLPLQSRNTMYYLTLLPGVSSSATASPRNPIINGLPSSTYNITIDGLNTQDNLNKNGDGFFSYISPSVDSVQEVTLSTATPGAEAAGQGAIQIKFTTRQGTNDFSGSLYYYLRNTALNSNYWFTNRDTRGLDVATGQRCQHFSAPTSGRAFDPDVCKAPRAKALFHQYGGRVGGPIRIPKLFDGKDRAFFFVNWEEFRQPNEVTRTQNILNPTTQSGVFQYVVSGQTRTVDLMALARANGHTATIDPVVGKLLADIRTSATSTGGVVQQSDPNLQQFTFSNGSSGKRYLPTSRIDINLTSKHTLSNTYSYHSYLTRPDTLNSLDPAFPGFPNFGGQASNRFAEGLTLRSILSPTIVNEARVGLTGGTVLFFAEINPGQFANQGGFNLGIGAASFNGVAITSATRSTNPQRRNSPVWDFADTVTWTRGTHGLTFGGQLTMISLFNQNQVVVPGITFGMAPADPAVSMFTTANFPGANATNLANAQSLYAVLTGRITAITANAVLDEKTNKYGYQAPIVQRVRQKEWGFFISDSWRARNNLTLTGGLRWEVQLPFTVENSIYSGPETINDLYGVSGPSLFKPGTLAGRETQFVQVQKGERLYNTQWNNLAPSIGFAWTPIAKSGFMKRVLGEGHTVFRGGYSIAYSRQGTASPINFYGANPGIQINASRSVTIGNLAAGTPADPYPVLLRETSRLGAPPFVPAPTYPFKGTITDQVNVFEPNLKTPYAQSWTFGIQREITRDTVIEARYVHTFNLQQWATYQFNEVNIVENGFLNEFKLAQANLQANIAAGRGNNFRYYGPNTGTSPLPIYLAHFSGLPAAQAGDQTKYTSSNFASANFVNPLALNNPSPYTPASSSATAGLFGSATFRNNALNAGLPANFWVVNPGLLGGTFIQSNGGFSKYDGLQVDLRRRMSHGLLLGANYTFGKGYEGTTGYRSGRAGTSG